MATGKSRAQGFAYMLLLVALAIIGLLATAAVTTGATLGRRDAENQLLVVGGEFERALVSYRRAGSAAGRGPKSLEELLKDSRFPGVRRHLRKIYEDPLTGRATWGQLKAQDGSILAIYSLAPGTPARRTAFGAGREHFENAATYDKWAFGLAEDAPSIAVPPKEPR